MLVVYQVDHFGGGYTSLSLVPECSIPNAETTTFISEMTKTMTSVTSFKMTAGRWSRCLFMSSPPTTSSNTPTQTCMEQHSHCDDPMTAASPKHPVPPPQLKNFHTGCYWCTYQLLGKRRRLQQKDTFGKTLRNNNNIIINNKKSRYQWTLIIEARRFSNRMRIKCWNFHPVPLDTLKMLPRKLKTMKWGSGCFHLCSFESNLIPQTKHRSLFKWFRYQLSMQIWGGKFF
jgi:hypothetical protein